VDFVTKVKPISDEASVGEQALLKKGQAVLLKLVVLVVVEVLLVLLQQMEEQVENLGQL